MKSIITLLVGILITLTSVAQLQWTKLEHLKDSLEKQPKPVLLKFETEWCSVCKMMDVKVFQDKKVQKVLANYYVVRIDAEIKTPLIYNDTTYNYLMYSAKRGVNQLAKKLAEENGKLAYPTIVIVENYVVQKRLVGYLPKSDFVFWMKS